MFSSSSPTTPQLPKAQRKADSGDQAPLERTLVVDFELHLIAFTKTSRKALNDQEQSQLLTNLSGDDLSPQFPYCNKNYGLEFGLWLEKCFSQSLALSSSFALHRG